eukprot:scaffold339_cov402-Prasinococcus_capsulatus_cf.AAC.23
MSGTAAAGGGGCGGRGAGLERDVCCAGLRLSVKQAARDGVEGLWEVFAEALSGRAPREVL